MAVGLRLQSDFASGSAALTLRLHNDGPRPLTGFKLGITGMFRIDEDAGLDGGALVSQFSHHQVVAPLADFVLAPSATWTLVARRIMTDASTQVPRHYSYGPQSAYLVLADGSFVTVVVSAMTRDGSVGNPARAQPTVVSLPAGESPIAVIPHPSSAKVAGVRDALPALTLKAGPGAARQAFVAAGDLAARLFGAVQPLFAEAGTPCVAHLELLEPEAYRIRFSPDEVAVFAAGHAGFLYAFITLGQMLHGARRHASAFVLPLSGEISDRPRFGYRGALMDLSRHIFPIDAVHRFLDIAAWHKLNRLHLHLSDDEGWRLDVPAYPQLAQLGGWRGHGLALPPMFGSPPERSGVVYSKTDVAALAERASSLGLALVPEIDVPGHSHAALRALPELRDPGETGTYWGVHFYPNNALNPAIEATYDFLETVFGTVADLFPASPLIHIGGDEVARGAWLGSPQVRALMQRHGWNETAQLQSHFLKRVQAIVTALGRKTGAWQEAAHGGGIAAAQSCLYAWINPESGLELAKAGYDVVLTPGDHYYLDMAQSDDWWEPGAAWAGASPVDRTYSFDPGGDWPAQLQPRLQGVQCALWGEPLGEGGELIEHLLFPRLSAVAESAWTPAVGKNLSRFLATQHLIPRPRL